MVESDNFAGKAAQLKAKGDKALKGSFFGNLMSSKGERADEAKDFYSQAANCYKYAEDYHSAIEMYLKCAECEDDQYIKAGFIKDAANVAQNVNSEQHMKLVGQATQLYILSGRSQGACTLNVQCAEQLEESHDYEQAAKYFQEAAKLLEKDNQQSKANSMWKKACDLSILSALEGKQKVDFAWLIKTYERIGFKMLNQNMLKTGAKDLFFRAALCYYANEDDVGGQRAIDKYQIEDPSFDGCRQHKFLNTYAVACEARDEQMFSKVVSEYQKISPLDKVSSKLVVWAKRAYCPEVIAQVAATPNQIDLVDDDSQQQNFQQQPNGQDFAEDEGDGGLDLT